MEVGHMEGTEIKSIQPEQILKISSKLNIEIRSPFQFYMDLLEKLGDFGSFISSGPINTTNEDKIYVNDNSVVVGKIIFSSCSSLHDAVLLAIVLHKIFKHIPDESCANLSAFILNMVGVKVNSSKRVGHYLNLIA